MKKILVCVLLSSLLFSCSNKNTNNRKQEDNQKVKEDVVLEDVYCIDDLNDIKTGDLLYFGKYEQDNDSSSLEDIKWIVVSKDDNYLELLSYYGLDSIKYSELSKWYKESLLSTFSEEETLYLVNCDLIDYISAETIFKTNEERKCIATEYAISKGAITYDDSKVCRWWLKTIDTTNGINTVRTDGHINYVDAKENDEGFVVRPLLKISIKPKEKETEKKEESKETIIEIIDDSMNVYSYADKSSEKTGTVTKGEKYVCTRYYENGAYKWYEIGNNKWIGDGNSNRVKLVSGKLNTVTSVEKYEKEDEYIELDCLSVLGDGPIFDWYQVGDNEWVKRKRTDILEIKEGKILVPKDEQFYYSTKYHDVFYSAVGDTLIIYGDDNGGVYASIDYPSNYKNDIKTLILSYDIIGIGENSFADWNIETLIFEGESKYIVNGAFKDCNKLKTIYLGPKSAYYVENEAFTNCPIEKIYYSGNQEDWNNEMSDVVPFNQENVEIIFNYD